MKLKLDAILSRILRETIIESELNITEDIVEELIANQAYVVKERMEQMLDTSIPELGTFRIRPGRERYYKSYLKLKEENPELNIRELLTLNKQIMGEVMKEEKKNKKKFIGSSMTLAKVTLVKKSND